MGLSLLHNKASPHESKIYTVCVNAIAYRFLTTVINFEDDSELVLELKKSATEYRVAAQAALKQIPLLTTPSIGLLQAIICGVSLSPSEVVRFNPSSELTTSRFFFTKCVATLI